MQPVEQGLFRRRAANAIIFAGDRVVKFLYGPELGRAEQRPAFVHAFEFDQLARRIVPGIGHGAHRQGAGDAALGIEEFQFVIAGGAMHQIDRDIAAQQHLSLILQAGEKGVAE